MQICKITQFFTVNQDGSIVRGPPSGSLPKAIDLGSSVSYSNYTEWITGSDLPDSNGGIFRNRTTDTGFVIDGWQTYAAYGTFGISIGELPLESY